MISLTKSNTVVNKEATKNPTIPAEMLVKKGKSNKGSNPKFHHFLCVAVMRGSVHGAEKILREIGSLQYMTINGEMRAITEDVASYYNAPRLRITQRRTSAHPMVRNELMRHSEGIRCSDLIQRTRKSGIRATVSDKQMKKLMTMLDEPGWVFQINKVRNVIWDAPAILALGILEANCSVSSSSVAREIYERVSHSSYADYARKLMRNFYGMEDQQEIAPVVGKTSKPSDSREDGLVRVAASSESEDMDTLKTTAELIARLVSSTMENMVETTVKKLVREGYLIGPHRRGAKKVENWVIEHDNGKPGLHGFSDGYRSYSEMMSEVNSMRKRGINVYTYYRAE